MTEQLKSVFDFAIKQEKAAADLYEKYSNIVKSSVSRNLLKEMAAIESAHEKKLSAYKEQESTALNNLKPVDIKLTDYMVKTPLTKDSTIQDVFLYSIQAEDLAYSLYTRMSENVPDQSLAGFFKVLAAEEKNHKLTLELDYERAFMKDN